MRSSTHNRQGVPGVVDDGVVVADAADQRGALQARAKPQRAGPSHMLLPRNGFRATELVVEQEAGSDVRAFPPPLGKRVQKRQRLDEVRRQGRQRQLALEERLTYQPEFQLLQVAQPAVKHLGRATRRAGGEVTRFDQRHFQPAGGGIQRGSRDHHTATDDHDVELFAAESLPRRGALLGSQKGARPGLLATRCENRVAHGTDPLLGYSSVGHWLPRLPNLLSPGRRAPSAAWLPP